MAQTNLNLIYDTINDKFGIGCFGEFEVAIMRSNGYVNVSKLVQQAKTKNGEPKLFKNWYQNDRSKELIEAVSATTRLPIESILQEVKQGGDQRLTGTYAHPVLVPMIAQWASAVYSIKVSHIMLKYHETENKAYQIQVLQEKADLTADLAEKKALLEETRAEIDNLKLLNYNLITDSRHKEYELETPNSIQ